MIGCHFCDRIIYSDEVGVVTIHLPDETTAGAPICQDCACRLGIEFPEGDYYVQQ